MTRPILLLVLACPSALMAQAPVPMHEEPRHRLVLTHQHLRVMDIQIQPGDTTLFHMHDAATLYVAVTASPIDVQLLNAAWGGTQADAAPVFQPGEVIVDTTYVHLPIAHRVTNVGSQLFNLIAITTSTVSPRASGPSEMPGSHEVQNHWFTQSRVQLAARAAPRWHAAISPTIVVQPVPGAATVMLESGGSHALNTPGSWALVPAGIRYQLTSPNSATVVVVQVR